MKLLKWSTMLLIVISFTTLVACGNSSAVITSENSTVDSKQKPEVEKKDITSTATSKIQPELDKAKKEGKAVFLVVTGTGLTDTDKALTIAKGANDISKNAVVIQMNRDDTANASLVAEWRLAAAPLPLILVLSSKGKPTGGYILAQASAENIAALVPSPKLEQVYDAIGNNKYAVLAFTKKSFADRANVLEECNKAVTMLNNEAVFIEVDMEDQKETGFMQQLRISPLIAQSSVTLVINKQGQVAGTSTTIPDAAKLVAAVKTPVKGGCGPGCGPAGCGK